MMDAPKTPPDAMPLTLADAAVRLGISPDAARKRLERGTLRGEKRAGRWRVILEPDAQMDADLDAPPDAGWTPLDATAAAHDNMVPGDTSPDSALVDRLQDEVAFLRSELDARTEEIRRRDHIIAGLVDSLRALPAGESPRDAPQDAHTAPLRGDVADMTQETVARVHRPAWRRWWQRLTGGG